MLARPQGLGLENGLVVSPWVAVFMGLTLVTNFTAVGAVAYRYWYVTMSRSLYVCKNLTSRLAY